MDRDLIVYLDAKFTDLDTRFTDQDAKLADLDAKVTDLDAKVTGLDVKVTAKFTDLDTEIRKNRKKIDQARVMLEEQGSSLKAVAEGHAMLDENMKRGFEEAKTERRQDRGDHRSAIRMQRERSDGLERRVVRLEAPG